MIRKGNIIKAINTDDRTITMDYKHTFKDSKGRDVCNRILTRKELISILSPIKTEDYVS